MKKYDFQKIENKWQKEWEKERVYTAKNNSAKEKKYILIEFPYPSGEGLHMGHLRPYTAGDVYSRYLRMKGYEVMYPMGWDAFGLPAENYAIKKGIQPKITTAKNIENAKDQLKSWGIGFDWSREVNTTDPEYYKWTQWIFLKLWKAGLAYEATGTINWCPKDKTGLANEEVVGGKCERCGAEVVQKEMKQWYLKITAYAEKLLAGLKNLNWPERIKIQQENWIGRSEGAELKFPISDSQFSITVFTTRPDTLFGATYMVLAPEHKLVQELKNRITNLKEVEDYIKRTKVKTEEERLTEGKEKTGVELKGIKAINPANKEEIPVFIADYVLASYGTGAIMAVPAHDERDFEFAKEYKLPIREVIKAYFAVQVDYPLELVDSVLERKLREKYEVENKNRSFVVYGSETKILNEVLEKLGVSNFNVISGKDEFFEIDTHGGEVNLPWIYGGVLVNSGRFNGMDVEKAKWAITKFVGGEKKNQYKLRDWVFSRQRYWGEPIPLVHCEKCGIVPVPEEELPVKLPEVEKYEPTGTGESPLAAIDSWVNVKCPKCGGPAKRETNTMPQWAGSSWYYLRYCDPKNKKELADKKLLKHWLPVDVYFGGMEHTTLHLLYSRFWHQFLYDQKIVPTPEPYTRRVPHGIILGSDGEKMSKSRGNVVSPDEIVKEFGADALRMHELFLGPHEAMVSWNSQGILGISRFLERVRDKFSEDVVKTSGKKVERVIHRTVKKVTEDIQAFKFNTAIPSLMICLNEIEKEMVARSPKEIFLKILAPFAPHLAEELWCELGNKTSIHKAEWPKYDSKLAAEEDFDLVVQVNGKLRATLKMPRGVSRGDAEQAAMTNDNVKNSLAGQKPQKIIFVPDRLINFVV